MAIITSENPYQFGVGDAVKIKNQPHSPSMTILGIQRGKVEGSNALVTLCQCAWFTEDGAQHGTACEMGALEKA